eukprot:15484209-Alexandrium_andersonii.AAC.1
MREGGTERGRPAKQPHSPIPPPTTCAHSPYRPHDAPTQAPNEKSGVARDQEWARRDGWDPATP